MVKEMTAALDFLSDNDEVGVLILSGALGTSVALFFLQDSALQLAVNASVAVALAAGGISRPAYGGTDRAPGSDLSLRGQHGYLG